MQVYSLCSGTVVEDEGGEECHGREGGGGGEATPVVTPVNTQPVQQMSHR